jgi:glutathione reductase (NADPH)
LKSQPKRVLVIGGGYIAVEFAGIFQGFGSETTIAYRADLPLRGFDLEVRETVATNLASRGTIVMPNTNPKEIKKNDDGSLTVSFDDDVDDITVDEVMWATGRVPNTDRPDLGLKEVGVELDKKGAVVVDDFSQTTVPSIYAVGDVTNRMNLTPVALMEGMAFKVPPRISQIQRLFDHTILTFFWQNSKGHRGFGQTHQAGLRKHRERGFLPTPRRDGRDD